MEEVKEKIRTLKQNNNFFKFILNGKNIAIIILSFLLFCYIVAYSDSDSYKHYSQIEDFNNQISELNSKIEDNEKQITNLQDANKLLQEEKSKLEEEKTTLETEKQELTTKVEELEKTSSTKLTSTTSTSQTQKSSSATLSSSTSSSKLSSGTSATTSTTNSQMVWVGETGTKYHNQGCRTLKGKGHQITMQQALAEGRQACKVCH